MNKLLQQGLKEWEIAIKALMSGETIMLLRKGGIKETKGQFTISAKEVLLYPTYEHQKPELLKRNYSDQVTPVISGFHPEQVIISAWAEITHIFVVNDLEKVEKLGKYHIWQENFITDKLKWKPQQPLYILLLSSYKLSQPTIITYDSDYGGCKSWIEVKQAIDVTNSHRVLDAESYLQRVEEIAKIIG